MMKIKEWFNTPKKAAVSCAVIAGCLLVLGTGTAFAASTVAENTSIGVAAAQNFAFADAGVDPAAAYVDRTEFDFERGQFVYEVEFIAEGTEYEYWIKANDGTVVKKEQELREDLHGSAFLLPNVPNCSQYTKSNFGAEYEDSHQMVKFCKGTTTLAFKFQGGVIVSVDSRATQGQFIGGERLGDVTS